MTLQTVNDYWLHLSRGSSNAHGGSPLSFKTLNDIAPLDAQLGTWPKKVVPDALFDALFGQNDSQIAADNDASQQSPQSTYAILDASKVTNLAEMLETSQLEHRCLFTGKSYENLKEVAPWLVRLEGDNFFTRNLFTRSNSARHLWDNEPGIYLRAGASFDHVWRHVRKFTRIHDSHGKWYFIRYYDPAAAFDLFAQKAYWEMIMSGAGISSVIVCKGGTAYVAVTGQEEELPASISAGFDFDIAKKAELDRKLRQNIRLTISNLDIPPEFHGQAKELARACMQRMMAYGFTNSRHLRVLAAWELSFGARYEEYDPEGKLLKLCQSNAPSLRRFKRFQKRMDEVSFKKKEFGRG
ncbi:DUF4123 domain-containing protein [Rhodovulum sulfidophilum]|uniref:DUF4123 domain-containing protein n=1 Tax=Rhodovulum sulfidophilum TaxID=35806 RepID=UPI0009D71E0A|nr:DUF4123 domain-containing protein [Rhodovulum sulfidophilum]